MGAFGVEREQGGPGNAVEHAAAMAASWRAVDRSKLIVSTRNFVALFNDLFGGVASCRIPTSRAMANRVLGACDPKGSKQRCNEFSTFKGGSFGSRPFFLARR